MLQEFYWLSTSTVKEGDEEVEMVCYFTKFEVIFVHTLDLRRFRFDRQVLRTAVTSGRISKELTFKQMHGRRHKIFKDFPNSGWNIALRDTTFPHIPELRSALIKTTLLSASSKSYPIYKIRLSAQRHSPWYFWNVFFVYFWW